MLSSTHEDRQRAFSACRPGPSAPAPPARSLYQCADQLLASREIPLQDHLLLRENVASYLSQMDPEVLTDQQKLEQAISEQSRWGYKVHRELDRPYTDQQVLELQVIQSQQGFLSDIYVQSLGRKGYQVSRMATSRSPFPSTARPAAPRRSGTALANRQGQPYD